MEVHIIQFMNAGNSSDYNTYHYEKRYIYQMVGDVETVSGSYLGGSGSFYTDFTGTMTSGIYTASKHISNKTFISNDIGLGNRPLGITYEFLPTGSIAIRGGKFLDETFVYPPNHHFLLGNSGDIFDPFYNGTQYAGGDSLESEAWTDLFP